MLFLGPDQTPRDRLQAIDASAWRSSSSPDVRHLAHGLWIAAGRDRRALPSAVLGLIAAPSWRGATEPDGTKGQWLDTDVIAVAARGGDCIDRTHAFLALAYALGLDAKPGWITEPGTLDHVAPVVRYEGVWLYADPLAVPPLLGTAPSGVAIQFAR